MEHRAESVEPIEVKAASEWNPLAPQESPLLMCLFVATSSVS